MGIAPTSRRRLLVWLVLLALIISVGVWLVTCDRQPADPGEIPAADFRPRPTITFEDSMATAVAFNEAWVATQPTATPAPDVVGPAPTASCMPPDGEPAGGSSHFLHWTPDGSQLIFDFSDSIWAVNSQGTRVDAVVDAYPLDTDAGNAPAFEFYADLSPDGSRMVYSTCEYPLVFSTSAGYEAYHLYEIATADIHGGGRQRLTESQGFESYPAWSPDGKTIAYIGGSGPLGDTWIYLQEEGFPVPRRWWLGEQDVAAYRSPPAWSPNSVSLALVAYESTPGGRQSCLYTGAAFGPDVFVYRTTQSAVYRVTEATGPPSWSPDGQQIAFTRSGGDDAGVYVVRPNGSEPQLVVDGTSEGPLWPSDVSGLREKANMFRGSPKWSPDGERMLFITREVVPDPLQGSTGFVPSRIFTVGLQGGDAVELELPLPDFVRVTEAAWSPDGSRVAVSGDIRQYQRGEYGARRVILTADPDGGSMRILAAGDTALSLVSGHYDESIGGLFEWNRPGHGESVDTASCSEGLVVPGPESNPVLVRDCETLLSIRDTLAGRVELNWNGQTPISDWQGIAVGGEPRMVRRLALSELGLTGSIPAELGLLSGLTDLDLSGNWLSGAIPPELGSLRELEALDLSANFLVGSIPAELGMLDRLYSLTLSGNGISGGIPREVFGLVSLRSLDLWDEFLTGCFASEYPEILEEANDEEGC